MKICNDAVNYPPSARKHSTAMLVACIWGLMTGCCAHADVPKGYFDDGEGLPPSSQCGKQYSGLVLPETSLANHHQYMLLLTFDNPTDSQLAGQKLFGADVDPNAKTAACFQDPDMPVTAKAGALGYGLKIKGGCPSDCIEPGLDGKTRRRNLDNYSGDPMSQFPQGKIHWGLFFVGANGESESSVRVWQIRVRDGDHAKKLYDILKNKFGLLQMPGYQGHLLIGYRPMPRD
jgi:hypothetical protein